MSKDWTYFYAVPALIMFLSVIALCFYEESPKFYYGTRQYDKARRCLTAIGRKNGTLDYKETFTATFDKEVSDTVVTNKKNKNSLSVRDFFKNKTNTCNAYIMIVIYLACPFCYYMMAFNIKYIPGDVFVN